MSRFLFITCQVGAEKAVKGEIARTWPNWPFAFSRPGFLTFKLDETQHLPGDFDLQSVFARAYGFSLGQVKADNEEQLARAVWQTFGDRPFQCIHVWERDRAEAGEHGFEPGITPAWPPMNRFAASAPALRPWRGQNSARRPGRATGSWIVCSSTRASGGWATIGRAQ